MNDTRLHPLADDLRTARRHVADILGTGTPHPDDVRELNVIDTLLATAQRRADALMRCTAVPFGSIARCELPPHGEDVKHRNGDRTWTTRSQNDLANRWGL